jgi:hypothetical protein
MRQRLSLSVALLALALAGCRPTSPATPCIRVVCKCASPIFVEAWIDRNGNGNCDPEDGPLQRVRSRLEWDEEKDDCRGYYTASHTLTTDKTGHDFYRLGGCGCLSQRINPETPAGYRLTTSTTGECLFSHPKNYGNYSMENLSCERYGFTPTSP